MHVKELDECHQVKNLEMGDYTGLSMWTQLQSQSSLLEGGKRVRVREEEVMTVTKVRVKFSEAGGRCHKPRNAVSFDKLENARYLLLLRGSCKNTVLLTHFGLETTKLLDNEFVLF